MDSRILNSTLRAIVSEDLGPGDVTMAFTPDRRIRARIIANESGFVSGVAEACKIFSLYGVKSRCKVSEGGRIERGDTVISLEGSSRRIFSLSRSSLNILARMSGITTQTRKYVDLLGKNGLHACVMATRKTTPLFRYFEKKAVKLGGGLPHRMGLYDMILLKHDHTPLFNDGVKGALIAAKDSKSRRRIEIEVNNVKDALEAAKGHPDVIMLDNMKPKEIKNITKTLEKLGLRRKVKIEVSGGIKLRNILKYASCGVDYLSIGELTHSPKSLDFALRVDD